MPEYRTPLPGILAGLLEGAVNRVLALDENTPALLRRLSGRHLQLDIAGIGITLFFSFADRRVRVRTRLDSEPDTVISGSPQALFAMAMPDGADGWQSGDSRVNITGDANLARDLERLFSQLDPDWEGSLSRVFGDVLGYQVSTGLRQGARQAREAAGEAGEMVDDFLRSGQAPVVHASEFAAFGKSLDELESTLQRIEDRLDRQQDKDR